MSTTAPAKDPTVPKTDAGCALVTGGSRGIGAAIAQELAAAGWNVAVASRSGAADETLAAIEGAGAQGVSLTADIADPAAAKTLLDGAAEAFGKPVLVLVNNAGIRHDDLALQLDDERWDEVINTNLNAAFRLTRTALKPMLKARWGRIINIASIVGLRANAGQSNYAAAKAGLMAMTATVAAEVARRNVTVNAVAPGFIATDMTAELPEGGLLDHVPARRAGTPDEVAACVGFLASERASYVTGSTLVVDGGLSA